MEGRRAEEFYPKEQVGGERERERERMLQKQVESTYRCFNLTLLTGHI